MRFDANKENRIQRRSASSEENLVFDKSRLSTHRSRGRSTPTGLEQRSRAEPALPQVPSKVLRRSSGHQTVKGTSANLGAGAPSRARH